MGGFTRFLTAVGLALGLGLPCGCSDPSTEPAGGETDTDDSPPPGMWGENPRFSPPGGAFVQDFKLILRARPLDATIRYTLDGTLPGPDSPAYDGPLQISDTTTVRAAIHQDGLVFGSVAHHYLRTDQPPTDFRSELPLLVLHTRGAPAPDPDAHDWVPASLSVFDVSPNGSRLRPVADQDLRVGIKRRGSSTLYQDKGNFSLEVWEQVDEDDLDASILGMPGGSDWVLFAPYSFDRTMIRNPLIYALSNSIDRYAPRTRLVELLLVTDGAEVDMAAYHGVYVLMEKIRRGPQRVPVASLANTVLEEPFISGGYILKLDRRAWDETGFDAGGSENFQEGLNFVYPREAGVPPQQLAYITDYIDDFAAAINASDFTHPTTGLGYHQYIDVDAFIDHHILNVLAKNPDALRLSTYMHKDRGGLLTAGPIWDFDRTMGSEDDRDDDPQGWDPTGDGTPMFDYGWWPRLFADPVFMARYRARWLELVENELHEDTIAATIDLLAADLAEAAQRNYERWPEQAPNGSHADEVDALKDWMQARVAWIRDNAPNL